VTETKAGPIIRINPYEVHILDPDFYTDLYSSARKLDKYGWWTKLAGADDSSFSTVPHDLHRLRRSALSPFFSSRSVSLLEQTLRSKIEKLSSRLATALETQEIIRLDVAFMALTMDIICTYSFAADMNYLDEPDFKLDWKQTIIGAFEGGALGRQFPFMLPLMKRLPISVVETLNPTVGYLFRWHAKVRAQVEPILNGKQVEGRTIFHALRDCDLPPEEKTLQRLCDEGEILVGAGSETTAQTLARMFFYLAGDGKRLLGRLRRELDEAAPDAARIPSWGELQRLPYLVCFRLW